MNKRLYLFGDWKFSILMHCRLLHLSLLLFNAVLLLSLSAISGGSKSVFSREENASAFVLVASQVITKSFIYQILWLPVKLGSNCQIIRSSLFWKIFCHLNIPLLNLFCNILRSLICCYTFQKTLPVMVAVIEPLRGALGESGLLILPCVAAHLNQVFDLSKHTNMFYFLVLKI